MVYPRDASTVVLVRPGGDGSFEILLTRRPQEMRFLGGYYVFPGGTVHRDDYSPLVLARCRGLSGEEARRILGSRHEPEEALGHWVAVVRELFEEVGVLLCVDDSGTLIDLSNHEASDRFEDGKALLRFVSRGLFRPLGDAGDLFDAFRHALLHRRAAAPSGPVDSFRRSHS